MQSFFSFLLKLLFITVDPIGSDDYYRYLWDGKVQANGINPFLYSPNDKNLDSLHSDLLPEKVSYPHIRTIYFPVSQMLFTVAYWISGESAVGLKIILFFAELLILISLYYLLLRFSIDMKYILIYAALPLVIFQFFIDAHIDLVGASLLLASVTLYFYDKKLFSYILLGLSISVKPTGLLLIPFLFQNELKLANKIKSVFIPIFIFILTFLPYAFTATPLDTLINYSANWTFNGMIYNILNIFFSDNLTIRILCGILFLLVYIFLFISKIDFLKKLYLVFIFINDILSSDSSLVFNLVCCFPSSDKKLLRYLFRGCNKSHFDHCCHISTDWHMARKFIYTARTIPSASNNFLL